jgi:hypothetical protein
MLPQLTSISKRVSASGSLYPPNNVSVCHFHWGVYKIME